MDLVWLAVVTVVVLLLLAWLLFLPQGPEDDPWSYPDLHPWDLEHGH